MLLEIVIVLALYIAVTHEFPGDYVMQLDKYHFRYKSTVIQETLI